MAESSSQESESELEDEKLIEAYAPKTEIQKPKAKESKVKESAKDAIKDKQKSIKQDNSLKIKNQEVKVVKPKKKQ